jgi:hypothetical protein
VEKETLESELARLKKEQRKTRENEVFGGLSINERAVYNEKSARIDELKTEIQASEEKSPSSKSEQRRYWNKNTETDTHQSEAHQPYGSREKESTNAQERQGREKPKEGRGRRS